MGHKFCTDQGYSNDLCDDEQIEHFTKHGMTIPGDTLPSAANGTLLFTHQFCEESVDMWNLNRVHHQSHGHSFAKEGNRAQCFPSRAEVLVKLQDGMIVARSMAQLKVGDMVRSSTGFSKLYAFGHHSTIMKTSYVKLKTAAGFTLTTTYNHIVFAHAERIPVWAGSVVEGDLLWVLADGVDFVSSRVTRVEDKEEYGMHAPFTEDGTIVVDHALASVFSVTKNTQWGDRIILSGHDKAKYIHEPLRIACAVQPSLCGLKWHDAQGQHLWTKFLINMVGWIPRLAQNVSYDLKESSLVVGLVQVVATVFLMLCAMLGTGVLTPLLGSCVVARVFFRRPSATSK
jgi:hypothetical protein